MPENPALISNNIGKIFQMSITLTNQKIKTQIHKFFPITYPIMSTPKEPASWIFCCPWSLYVRNVSTMTHRNGNFSLLHILSNHNNETKIRSLCKYRTTGQKKKTKNKYGLRERGDVWGFEFYVFFLVLQMLFPEVLFWVLYLPQSTWSIVLSVHALFDVCNHVPIHVVILMSNRKKFY